MDNHMGCLGIQYAVHVSYAYLYVRFCVQTNSEMNAQMPFAVVGSTDFVRVGNKMVRARQYPWGTVQGEAGGGERGHYYYIAGLKQSLVN